MANDIMEAPLPREPLRLPASTKMDLSDVNVLLYAVVSKWLKNHGKGVKPKLSDQQKEEFQQVFKLMDGDGSGAIDVEELGAAFKLLGFNLRKSEILELVKEVDHDGTGELEYNEFLEVMTTTLLKLSERMQNGHSSQPQVPFALMTTAYKRKKLLEGIFDGTKESLASIVHTGEQEERAREKEKLEAESRAQRRALAAQSNANKAHYSRAVHKLSAQSSLSPALLAGTLSPAELRVVAELVGKSEAETSSKQQWGGAAGTRQRSSLPMLPHLGRVPQTFPHIKPLPAEVAAASISHAHKTHKLPDVESRTSSLGTGMLEPDIWEIRTSPGRMSPGRASPAAAGPRVFARRNSGLDAKFLRGVSNSGTGPVSVPLKGSLPVLMHQQSSLSRSRTAL